MKKPVCFGVGLVALDVILNGSPATLPKLSAGGSCGNVLSVLGFLGWNSYPIARLANNRAGDELVKDLKRWHIHTDHLHRNEDGRTPIIIHRIKRDKQGKPVHRFEFKDPETGSWLPQLKPVTKSVAAEVLQGNVSPEVFYFDRLNPGTFELAKNLKEQGTIIFFEPSSIKDRDQFEQFLEVTDILKYSHERLPNYKALFRSPRCFLEVETRGKEGLLYRSNNHANPTHWHTIPGFVLEDIQDAAGAGDWCTAGIIHLLCLEGRQKFFKTEAKRLHRALLFGSVLGAMNCFYDGARGLMYHYSREQLLSDVEYFITNNGIDAKEMVKSPRIDISTHLKFSDLYKMTK
ncbi:MAG TPA: carbohydrate kinase family protein [Niabella sp.]|nr:carbohydrate kinase family protein [Niabella sp.]